MPNFQLDLQLLAISYGLKNWKKVRKNVILLPSCLFFDVVHYEAGIGIGDHFDKVISEEDKQGSETNFPFWSSHRDSFVFLSAIYFSS